MKIKPWLVITGFAILFLILRFYFYNLVCTAPSMIMKTGLSADMVQQYYNSFMVSGTMVCILPLANMFNSKNRYIIIVSVLASIIFTSVFFVFRWL